MHGETRPVVWCIVVAAMVAVARGDRHYFLRQPFNYTVRVGGTAYLRCAIANKQTDVQWVVDGFGLGTTFDDPRLSFAGNEAKGEYNLRITDVRLSDDGMYHCQVTPDYSRKIEALISRTAHLDVIVPPKKIDLEPALFGAIDVNLSESVKITCTVPDTKPASVIRWRVGGKDYEGPVSKRSSTERGTKLVTTSNSITLKPRKSENGTTVECVVDHKAMDAPVSRIATLNVLHPPSLPKISGFQVRPMRSGEELLAKCESTGGNPLAKITWLIGDEIVSREYKHTKTKSQSFLRHKLRPRDNGKTLKCRVESPALDSALSDQVTLVVYYPPDEILIVREPEEGVQENGVTSFTCLYQDSYPRASLAWYIGGVKLPLHWDAGVTSTPYVIRNLEEENSAPRTSLTLTSVRRQDTDLTITCRASIPEIGYSGQATTHPKINYPPRKVEVTIFSLSSPVTISPKDELSSLASNVNGKADGSEVAYKAGDIIMLRCVAKGGNPPPNLVWYLGDELVTADENTAVSAPEEKVQTERGDGDSVYGEFVTTSTVELTLAPSHNAAEISCVADHPGYKNTLTDKRTLRVAFPPRSLSVEQFPSSLAAGKPMSLTCTASPSNPAPVIAWFHNGVEIASHNSLDLPQSRGSFGGIVTSSRLRLTAEVEYDGSDITCKAESRVLHESVTQPYRLSVEYPPIFFPINGNNTSFNATEGDSFIDIEAIARANPGRMTFSWFRIVPAVNDAGGIQTLTKRPLTRDGRFVWGEDKGSLRVNNLKREDGGLYSVRATNSRGSTDLNITLNVFYPAKIVRLVGPTTILTEGDSTSVRCDYKSHALTPVYVKWVKEAPGIGRKHYNVQTYSDHSILSLNNLTAADRGGYKCIVDNGVGDPDSAHRSVRLYHSPVFARSTPSKVAVSSVSEDGALSPAAVLPCVVHSPPGITLVWMEGNRTIVPTKSSGYSILQEVVDSETTRSVLRVTRLYTEPIKKNETEEVAEFTCLASNQQGRSMKRITIVLQGPPDAPHDLNVYNVTDSAIHLTWTRGFDGGVRQEFVVQYKEYSKDMYAGNFKEVISKTNQITIGDLEPNRDYIIQLVARNSYGQSKPSENVRVKTARSLQQESKDAWDTFRVNKAYVIVLAVVSVTVFVFVVAIAAITFRRCKISKQTYKPKTIETDCESLTHAESSLSSRGSGGKQHEGEKLVEREDERKLRSDEISDEMQPLRNEEEPPVHVDVLEEARCGYFDCSASGCSSHHSIERCEDGNCVPSPCSSFPPITRLPFDRFKFTTQSARIDRPITEQSFPPRNCSEPRFRVDVVPTDDCLARIQDNCCEKSLDLPLPPALPLYEQRSYMKKANAGSSCEALSACSFSGAQGIQGSVARSSFRQYRTLEPAKFGQNLYYDECCGPMHDSRTSFIHSNPSRNPAVSSNSTETCLYNIVSRPGEGYRYGTSLMSMPDNAADQYAVDLDEGRARSSHSSSSSNSGIYARSMDNMLSQPEGVSRRRASIVNDDGSINTFGFDLPPPMDSRTLDVIRESQSQDPLPSFSNPTDYQTAVTTNERFASRKSSLKGITSTLPATKRALTPSVRFRDELSRALTSPTPRNVPADNRLANHGHSDDDADSGCGGSADVAVHSVQSPISPTGSKHSAFTPVSGEGSREEMVLRI